MRLITNLNESWKFVKEHVELEKLYDADSIAVNVPYTWNNLDGQDGGANYYRGSCWFYKDLAVPQLKEGQEAYLEFQGVNASADVYVNGKLAGHHDGGYSTFRVKITEFLEAKNRLAVLVDNSENDRVYPQKADFTFYGGIYRDVNLIIVEKNHFDLDYFGSIGAKITSTVEEKKGLLLVEPYVVGEGEVKVTLCNAQGKVVAEGKGGEQLEVENVHLWDGLDDPYLYQVKIELISNGEVCDVIEKNVGFRFFKVDPKKGFFLNGRQYKLRGVCRHQDRKGLGNALDKHHHKEDMDMILDIGANTIRLAHYQQDDYVLDLCDKYGFVVWVEIPYISQHMDNGSDNLTTQMKELVYQQYHHASIVAWGISNEITMFKGHQKQLVKENIRLNDIVHEIDKTRLTTMACFSMCGPFNKVAKITDVVSWNLYFGWYVPFKFLNKLWFGFYHLTHPKTCVGLSEYGAEAMTFLHSNSPRVGDSTEDYQASYHEYMLKFFEKRDYLWATHIWNMFDFGSDGRDHGGDPGVNHKGLVTFDHKTKKDSYFINKAYWSKSPFVHITGKRFQNRDKASFECKVYTNQEEVSLYKNNELLATKKAKHHVCKFKVAFGDAKTIEIKAVANNQNDFATFNKVDKFDENYKLHAKSNNYSWEK